MHLEEIFTPVNIGLITDSRKAAAARNFGRIPENAAVSLFDK